MHWYGWWIGLQLTWLQWKDCYFEIKLFFIQITPMLRTLNGKGINGLKNGPKFHSIHLTEWRNIFFFELALFLVWIMITFDEINKGNVIFGFFGLFQPIIWFFSIQSLFHLFSLYNSHFWININQMTNKKKLIHHAGSILDIIEKISIKIILPHHYPTPFFVLFLSNSSISLIYWIFMIWEDYLVISLWKRWIKWTFGNNKWNENKSKEKYYLYLPLSKFQNMRK